MSEHPWWVKVLALLTGKTETQIAWRLRQRKEEVDSEPVQTPQPKPSEVFRKNRPADPWWYGVVRVCSGCACDLSLRRDLHGLVCPGRIGDRW